MEFFTNKSIWSKIIIALVIVLLMEFVITKPSLGADVADALEFGGKLISPVASLAIMLADATQDIMQTSIMGTGDSLIHINTEDNWEGPLKWIISAAVVVGIGAAVIISAIATGGGSLVGWIAVGIKAATVVIATLPATKLVHGAVSNIWEECKTSLSGFNKELVPDELYLPAYTLSPEEIFKGNILLFNVDFFGKPKEIKTKLKKEENGDQEVVEGYYYEDENGNSIATSPQDIGAQLSATISKWYVSLRYIGLVIMMIVLLYVGIRMLISTVASDKAKYKQMLQDWFMGMVILFSIHYIMVFSNMMINQLVKVISTSADKNNYAVYIEDKDNNKLTDFMKDNGMGDFVSEDGKSILYPTNLMGSLRLRLQLARYGTKYIGYAICFIVLVFFTAFFVFTYLKRVIYMAFLTLMAPLVAVTYPIDKLNDGQAQGFNKWFKEYIFNLLIQPLHLLLYYILVTSAFELAGENVIYSIVAIGFMMPAEKLLRSFFGFEKSATAPSLFAGAALTTGMMQLMRPKIPKGVPGKGAKVNGANSSLNEGGDTSKVRMPSSNVNSEAEMAGSTINKTQKESRLDEEQKLSDKDIKALGDMNPDDNTSQEYANASQLDVNANKDENLRTIKKPTHRQMLKAKRYVHAKGARAWAGFKQHGAGSFMRATGNIGRTLGAGAGAAIGFASGVAQGDMGKALSGAVAGTAVGATIGKGQTESGAVKLDEWQKKYGSETADQAEMRIRNSNNYEQLAQYEQMQKDKKEMKRTLKNNGHNKDSDMYKQIIGDKDQEGTFEKIYSQGINDNRQILQINQMKNNNEIDSLTEGIALAKTANEIGKDTGGKANRKKWKEEWADRYKDKGFSKADAESGATKTVDRALKFNKSVQDLYK